MKYSLYILFLFLKNSFSQNTVSSKILENKIVKLPYAIEFYWQQEPYNNKGEFDISMLYNVQYLNLPKAYWSRLDKINAVGYGTYLLHLKLPDTINSYSLYIPRFLGACKIWVNEKYQLTHGNYNNNIDMSTSNGKPISITLPKQRDIIVAIATRNSEHFIGGGINYFIAAAKTEVLKGYTNNETIKDFIVFILLLLLALYQLYLFYIYGEPRYLYMMLACFAGCIRCISVQQNIIYNIVSPNIPFYVVQKIRFITVVVGSVSSLLYYRELLPKQIHQFWFRLLLFSQVLCLVLYFVLNIYNAICLSVVMRFLLLIEICYGISLIWLAYRQKEKYAKELLITILFICVIVVNGVLKTGVVVNRYYVGGYAIFIYLFIHMIINAKIQKNQGQQLILLTSELDFKKEQIRELKLETISRIHEKEKIKSFLKSFVNKNNSVVRSFLADMQSKSNEDQKAIVLKEEVAMDTVEFASRLKELHPIVTKTDIEIATFIKIGKTRQEIADLRGVATTSIKTSRNRLRKKLALPNDILLDDYLKEL